VTSFQGGAGASQMILLMFILGALVALA